MHNSRHVCGIVPANLPAAPRTKLLSLAPLAVWCAAMAGLGTWLSGQPSDPGGLAELVPPEHRPPAASLVRLALRGADAEESWPQVVDRLGPLLPGHTPLAPPPTEARSWLDAHVLYRIAPDDHAALTRRLEPAALRAAVAGVRARLASPLFGVGDEDPRRDPLGLRALSEAQPGHLGFLAGATGPTPTASGDLLSADGRSLLLYLRTDLPAERLHAWISAQLASRFDTAAGIELIVVPITLSSADVAKSGMRGVDLLAATIAGLALVLALGLRRLRFSLAVVLLIGVGAPLLVALAGGIHLLTGPLVLAGLGLTAALAPGVGPAGAATPLRLALALLPLLLLPYPAWQRWPWVWAVGMLALVAAARSLAPPLLRVLAARAPAEPPAPRRNGPPALALALSGALLALGTWSAGHVPSVQFEMPGADAALAGEFFAPSRVAELRSVGADGPAALAAAAADATRLAALVPAAAARIDAPGAFVLGADEAAARQAALAAMDLPGRVELLRVALTEQGLRPDAFGEFLRALDPTRPPTPEAALAGPLAEWFASRLEPAEAGVAAMTRVYLADALPAEAPLPADLRGPAVFAHAEAQRTGARLGLTLAASAWLSAFLAWLGSRSLVVALAASLVGLAAQAGALALAVAARGVGLALLLPALLLVGAVAADLAARSCAPPPRSAGPERGRPALALACQVVPGLVLLAAPEPAWRSFGLILAFGGVLGFALATRVAPALCGARRGFPREEPRP